MGFRFHKSIPLLPFVRLNLSKSGISFSFGPRGAALNIGSSGARGSLGIPGTGLSYRKTLVGGSSGPWRSLWRLLLLAALVLAGCYVYSLLYGSGKGVMHDVPALAWAIKAVGKGYNFAFGLFQKIAGFFGGK